MAEVNVVAEKIRKLMAHEASAREIGNVAEAESFAAKIQDLLLRHKLSMSDVDLHADPYGHEGSQAARPVKRAQDWSHILARAAASACMCDVVAISGTNAIVFIGRAADRKIAIGIWGFLYTLALQLAVDDLNAIAKRSRMHPLKARNRYLSGFATAIFMRLARKKAEVVEQSGEAGLVRVHAEEKALAEYKAGAMRVTSRQFSRPRDSLAFQAGFARGVAAPLRKQHTLEVPSGH